MNGRGSAGHATSIRVLGAEHDRVNDGVGQFGCGFRTSGPAAHGDP